MKEVSISRQTARRFILGRQGLWPGRRQSGHTGVDAAIRQSESIQIDTINVCGRSHDLALSARVDGYEPSHLDALMYRERKFFDFGGVLMIYPLSELLHWQVVMRARYERSVEGHASHVLHEYVLAEIRARGPLGNRDFAGRERLPGGYRTMKDTGLALDRLWYGGRLMTHGRRGFDRLYDLFENVTGQEFGGETAGEEETATFMALKALRDVGLGTSSEWWRRLRIMVYPFGPDALMKQRILELQSEGTVLRVRIDGLPGVYFAPLEDAGVLEDLEAGKIPGGWEPVRTTTTEEATLIAPLDNVIWDRGRCQSVFGFEYIWEVYKPEEQRRWGYYTLPVLWGDRLAARLHPHADRKTRTLSVRGFWPEPGIALDDASFVKALAAGLARLARLNDCGSVGLDAVLPARFRQRLARAVRSLN